MKRRRHVFVDWSCPRVQAVLLKYDAAPQAAADYLGCALATVTRARVRLGLSPGRHPRIDWGPWDHLLGRLRDRELAARMSVALGRPVTVSAITHRRDALGVRAWSARRRAPMEVRL